MQLKPIFKRKRLFVSRMSRLIFLLFEMISKPPPLLTLLALLLLLLLAERG